MWGWLTKDFCCLKCTLRVEVEDPDWTCLPYNMLSVRMSGLIPDPHSVAESAMCSLSKFKGWCMSEGGHQWWIISLWESAQPNDLQMMLLAVTDWSHPFANASLSPTAKWAVDLGRCEEPFHNPSLRVTSDPELHMFCHYGGGRRQKNQGSQGGCGLSEGPTLSVGARHDHGNWTSLPVFVSFFCIKKSGFF